MMEALSEMDDFGSDETRAKEEKENTCEKTKRDGMFAERAEELAAGAKTQMRGQDVGAPEEMDYQ